MTSPNNPHSDEDPQGIIRDFMAGAYPDQSDDDHQYHGAFHSDSPVETPTGVRTVTYLRNRDGSFDRANSETSETDSDESPYWSESEDMEGPPGSEKWSMNKWTTWYEERTGFRLFAISCTESPVVLAPGGEYKRGWWIEFHASKSRPCLPSEESSSPDVIRFWSNIRNDFLRYLDGWSGHGEIDRSAFAHHLKHSLDPNLRNQENFQVSMDNTYAIYDREEAGVKMRDFAYK